MGACYQCVFLARFVPMFVRVKVRLVVNYGFGISYPTRFWVGSCDEFKNVLSEDLYCD